MRTTIFAVASVASCRLADGYNIQMKPAVYTPDELEDKPAVALCDGKGVVIRTTEFLDLCLTITSPQQDDKPKSFTCSSLLYRSLGAVDKYMIEEGGDSCMIKMRGYANSKGVSLSAPIQFSYALEKDPSGVHDSVGTVAVHLKWTQQDRPVNQLVNRDNVGGSLSAENPASLILSALLIITTLVL